MEKNEQKRFKEKSYTRFLRKVVIYNCVFMPLRILIAKFRKHTPEYFSHRKLYYITPARKIRDMKVTSLGRMLHLAACMPQKILRNV